MSGGGGLSVGRMSEEEVARCVRIPPASVPPVIPSHLPPQLSAALTALRRRWGDIFQGPVDQRVSMEVLCRGAFSVAELASARPSLTDAETVAAVGLAERAIAAIDQHTKKGSSP